MATYAASKPRFQFALPRTALPLLVLGASAAAVVGLVVLSVWFDGRWTQAATAAGVVATVVAAGVLLGSSQGWANGTRLSFAAIATGIIGISAVTLAVVTYVGGTSDAGLSSSSTTNVTTASDQASLGGVLSQQQSNNDIVPPGYSHDPGMHPTFNQFMSESDAQVLANVPGGTLLPEEIPVLRTQLQDARQVALTYNTIDKARQAGYFIYTNDVPFMGAHLINPAYLNDGVFDAGKPEGLLFSKLGNTQGEWQLVGVWYLLFPGQAGSTDTLPPEGFAGRLDLWHEHHGLCTRGGIISENNTFEGCTADHGNWTGDIRWMMHTWVYPESGVDNSAGVFSYLNNDLYAQQTKAGNIGPGLR